MQTTGLPLLLLLTRTETCTLGQDWRVGCTTEWVVRPKATAGTTITTSTTRHTLKPTADREAGPGSTWKITLPFRSAPLSGRFHKQVHAMAECLLKVPPKTFCLKIKGLASYRATHPHLLNGLIWDSAQHMSLVISIWRTW